MRKLSLALAALALFTVVAGAATHPAFAAEVKVQQESLIPEPPKLTINDCLTILRGLRGDGRPNSSDFGLDGYIRVANAGTPNEKSYTQAYAFNNAALRGAIQENLTRLEKIPDEVEKQRQKIFSEVAKDAKEIQPGSPEMDIYVKQVTAYGQSACHVTLIRIKRADLKLDTNEIPGSVLASLDKILDK